MTVYTLYPPSISKGTYKFFFDSTVGGKAWKFSFEWRTNHWTACMTLPDGSLREAGVIPNVLNWSRNVDYYIMFTLSSAEEVLLTNIGDISINVFVL